MDRAICCRLSEHLAGHDLCDPFQSANRSHHSTETALLKVMNDIPHGVHGVEILLLILLDLSAAFDTIDHDNILARLEFGIRGTVLNVVKSYLIDRTQTVVINWTSSSSAGLSRVVAQTWVLGPTLLNLFNQAVNINSSITCIWITTSSASSSKSLFCYGNHNPNIILLSGIKRS